MLLVKNITKMFENYMFSKTWCSLTTLVYSLTQDVNLEIKNEKKMSDSIH